MSSNNIIVPLWTNSAAAAAPRADPATSEGTKPAKAKKRRRVSREKVLSRAEAKARRQYRDDLRTLDHMTEEEESDLYAMHPELMPFFKDKAPYPAGWPNPQDEGSAESTFGESMPRGVDICRPVGGAADVANQQAARKAALAVRGMRSEAMRETIILSTEEDMARDSPGKAYADLCLPGATPRAVPTAARRSRIDPALRRALEEVKPTVHPNSQMDTAPFRAAVRGAQGFLRETKFGEVPGLPFYVDNST